MNNKEIPNHVLEALAVSAVRKTVNEENIEFGRALKNISEDQLKMILRGSQPRVVPFKKFFRERIAWAVSIAAMLALVITIPLNIEKNSRHEIDGLIYAYNSPDLAPIQLPTKGGDVFINITSLSDIELKGKLSQLETAYSESEELQEYAINGKILSLAYIRLHKRNEAKSVLKSMIEKLSVEKEDYAPSIQWCETILNQLK